jgi:hypothetical protein
MIGEVKINENRVDNMYWMIYIQYMNIKQYNEEGGEAHEPVDTQEHPGRDTQNIKKAGNRQGNKHAAAHPQHPDRLHSEGGKEMMEQKRTCYRCGQTKDITEFGVNNSRPGGIRAECKQCGREIGRKWAKENKEFTAEFRRKYFIQSGNDQKNRRDIKGLVKRNFPSDGYCELCHKNNKRLAYHHWDDNFPSWGIWMCAGCHVGTNFVDKTELLRKYQALKVEIEDIYNPDVSNVPNGIGELKQLHSLSKKGEIL